MRAAVMPPDRKVIWGVRDSGLYIQIDDREAVIPTAQYTTLILTLVGELKRISRDREGRKV